MNQNIKKYFFDFCVAKIHSCVSGILTSSISLAADLCLRHMSCVQGLCLMSRVHLMSYASDLRLVSGLRNMPGDR